MYEESDVILNKLYKKLYDNIQKKKKKLDENSIIITFLKTKSNEIFRLLSESSISENKIPKDLLKDLISNKLIRATDKISEYSITAKGVWEVESKNNIISNDKLLSYIDQKFFNIYHIVEKPLTDSERIVLFSMLASRTFSDTSSVDLNKDRHALDVWKEIIDSSYDKLKELKLLSDDKKELYGKGGNEHATAYLFRHMNDLQKKTRGLFIEIQGKRKYFLGIYKEDEIDKDALKYLFNLILGKRVLSSSETKDLYNFCCQIAHNKNIYLFDPKTHIFVSSDFDQIIKDTLFF